MSVASHDIIHVFPDTRLASSLLCLQQLVPLSELPGGGATATTLVLPYPRALRLVLADEGDIDPEFLSCAKKMPLFTELLFSHFPVDIELVESLCEVSFATVGDGDDNDGFLRYIIFAPWGFLP